jgi:hypothetical protein
MNATTFSRAIATALIILGFAVTGPGVRTADAQPTPCPGASCDVIVAVTGSPPSPTITVSANELRMGKGNRNVMIVWKLEAKDYEFRRGSIKAYTGAPAGGKQTTTQAAWDAQCEFVNNTPSTYRIRNRNSAAATFYYDVTVYHKATGTAHKLDPAIINDP